MIGEEMVKLMKELKGIFIFKAGIADIILVVYPVFKVHLLLGLTISLVSSFIRLGHMLVVPLRYIWRSSYQIMRRKAAE